MATKKSPVELTGFVHDTTEDAASKSAIVKPAKGDEQAAQVQATAALAREEVEDRAEIAKEEKREAATDARHERSIEAQKASDDRRYTFYQLVLVAVIGAIPATLVGTAGIIVAWRSSSSIDHKLGEYKHEVNSMKDELVVAVEKIAFDKGVVEGEKDGKAERKKDDGAKSDFGRQLLEASRQQKVMVAK